MVKPISLSVHKNTLEQRRRKLCRKRMVDSAKDLSHSATYAGFFIVAWDKDGQWRADYYDPQRIVGRSTMPNYVAGVAARYVAQLDRKDDD